MVQEVNPKDESSPAPLPDLEETQEPPGEAVLDGTNANEEWRAEFPYPWDEDEIMTRRDTLRFLLAGSGALFLATSALAIIGHLPSGSNVKAVPIAKVGELAENKWRCLTSLTSTPRESSSICRGTSSWPTVMFARIYLAQWSTREMVNFIVPAMMAFLMHLLATSWQDHQRDHSHSFNWLFKTEQFTQ